MKYSQNGKVKHWHLVESRSVVAGIAFDKKKNSFLLVKQFRPPVYYNNTLRYQLELQKQKQKQSLTQTNAKNKTNSDNNATNSSQTDSNINYNSKIKDLSSKEAEKVGCTYELCAGLLDKPQLTAKETMKEEYLEELGYDVPLENIQEITNYTMHTGLIGNNCTLFLAFIDDSMKSNEFNGGGIDDENIELIWLPVKKSKQFLMDKNKNVHPGLLFALFWFYFKYPQFCMQIS